MTTRIVSNGSRFAGGSPAPLPELYRVLEGHPLEPQLSYRVRPTVRSDGEWAFRGNFTDLSHVFDIRSSDPELVRSLRLAMVRNHRRTWRSDADDPVIPVMEPNED